MRPPTGLGLLRQTQVSQLRWLNVKAQEPQALSVPCQEAQIPTSISTA